MRSASRTQLTQVYALVRELLLFAVKVCHLVDELVDGL